MNSKYFTDAENIGRLYMAKTAGQISDIEFAREFEKVAISITPFQVALQRFGRGMGEFGKGFKDLWRSGKRSVTGAWNRGKNSFTDENGWGHRAVNYAKENKWKTGLGVAGTAGAIGGVGYLMSRPSTNFPQQQGYQYGYPQYR